MKQLLTAAARGLALLACALPGAAAAGPPAAADAGAAAPAAPGTRLARHLREAPRLLDLPARRRLEDDGVSLQLFYNQLLAWKPRGGADPDDTQGYSGSYDFFTRVDAEELLGLTGLDLLLHVKGQYDENVNADVGALSDPIDDADFTEAIYVDELWLEQWLFDDRLRLRAGFLEQQTLWDRNAYANSEDVQFLTTFLDNNPLVPLPNGLGAAVVATPWPWLDVAAGVADADNTPTHPGFDTAFDGFGSLDVYFELSARLALPARGRALPGHVRAGFFRDGRRRTVFHGSVGPEGPATSRGALGAYLGFDQAVTREPGEGEQGLGVFGRFGYADGDTSAIEWFWSLGGQYEGPVAGRDRDVVGLGVYQAIASGRYHDRVNSRFDGETGIELYYRVAVLPWLAVTPDFQYVIDPGGQRGTRDAVVAVLRFRATF